MGFAIKKDIVTKLTEIFTASKRQNRDDETTSEQGGCPFYPDSSSRGDGIKWTSTSANCWTDHQILWSKVAFRIRQKHNRQVKVSRPSSTLQN